MKRLVLLLMVVYLGALPAMAVAGDYHVGATLVCTDCHSLHASQSHDYPWLGQQPPAPVGGPHEYLLRQEPNALCMSCHDGNTGVPDVVGVSASGATRRQAGALPLASGHGTNPTGYEETAGHPLYSALPPPGGTGTFVPDPVEGLECINCHAQHGIATQYRNLLNRGIFGGKSLTYAASTNDITKDVFERSALAYTDQDVDFNEPDQKASRYANWCKTCHTNFHGTAGGPEVGGQSGGSSTEPDNPWVRHPNADVNIGTDPGLSGTGAPTDSSSFVSSYVNRYYTRINRVKVMAPNNNWLPAPTDPRVLTPSCFSCHKAHGNKNGFGLIFMNGSTGSPTPSEEGDGGQYKDLCLQCHSQGSYALNP